MFRRYRFMVRESERKKQAYSDSPNAKT